MCPFERGAEPVAHLARPHPQCDQCPSCRQPPEERTDQLDRRRVRPVDVVEHEHDRPRLRERLEQGAHGAVASVPLVLDRRSVADGQAGQRRKHGGELCADIILEVVQALRIQAVDVLVERVDEDPERQVELELPGSPREDEVPARVGTDSELGEKPRLADSGLPDHFERRGLSPSDLGEEAVHRVEL